MNPWESQITQSADPQLICLISTKPQKQNNKHILSKKNVVHKQFYKWPFFICDVNSRKITVKNLFVIKLRGPDVWISSILKFKTLSKYND